MFSWFGVSFTNSNKKHLKLSPQVKASGFRLTSDLITLGLCHQVIKPHDWTRIITAFLNIGTSAVGKHKPTQLQEICGRCFQRDHCNPYTQMLKNTAKVSS